MSPDEKNRFGLKYDEDLNKILEKLGDDRELLEGAFKNSKHAEFYEYICCGGDEAEFIDHGLWLATMLIEHPDWEAFCFQPDRGEREPLIWIFAGTKAAIISILEMARALSG